MLGYFFKRVSEQVMPRLPGARRRMGVWLADADNAQRPDCAACAWNPVDLAALPHDALCALLAAVLCIASMAVVCVCGGGVDACGPWEGQAGVFHPCDASTAHVPYTRPSTTPMGALAGLAAHGERCSAGPHTPF